MAWRWLGERESHDVVPEALTKPFEEYCGVSYIIIT
jgi:hypothetical protein